MNSSRLYKLALTAGLCLLLVVAYASQSGLNRLRDELGLTRITALKNAPPVLVITTQVLGGFRGLLANALWVRAMELQDQDKFFEMVQLADWITKLQPYIKTVWTVQAWNMSYNISIKFTNPAERWMWVRRGIELLRDEGLKYNPHEVLLYRELAWHFQHKMGHYLDDAHLYYKGIWAVEMTGVLGGGRPDFEALIHPPNEEVAARVKRLREQYKMDPAIMKAVDDEYGPLDWRLPETHGIYWAVVGRREAKTKEDLIQLRRVIYQSMQLAFQRGRVINNTIERRYEYGPNLDIIPKVNATYEQMMAEDAEMRDHISRAHKNFLIDATYFLYTHSRLREAAQWYNVIKEKYPQDYPQNMSLDEFALRKIAEDIGETSPDRINAILSGVLVNHFYNLALGEDDQANGYAALARNIWTRYQSKIVGGTSEKRVGLPPLDEIKAQVVQRLLDPEAGFTPAMAAALRTRLNLPAPEVSTNAPIKPAVTGTNTLSALSGTNTVARTNAPAAK